MPYAKQVLFLSILAVRLAGQAADAYVETPIADLCTRTSGTYAPVSTRGIVIDAFQDDIDPNVSFLLLKDGEYAIPVAITRLPDERLRAFLDCEVAVKGECLPITGDRTNRTFAGPFIDTVNNNSVVTVRPAPSDPFDYPPLENLFRANPLTIARMGKRTVTGIVLVAWEPRAALVRLDDRRIVKLEMLDDDALPAPGTALRAAGYPTTDQFHLNLQRVVWKPLSDERRPFDSPEDVSAATLLGKHGKPAIDPTCYGRTVRLTGIVRSVPKSADRRERLYVESDGRLLAVDRGLHPKAFDGLVIGSTLSVTGICLLDSADWQPFDVFPRLKGVTLVLRDTDDLVVLSRPSWWTGRRVGWVILSLVVILVAILIWNRILNRLVATRTRQLLREEVAAVRADLRTSERTNLAIELHDALSQNLTGVALEVKAVARLAPKNLPAALDHLACVQRSLGACREELRTCLWDLRNDASGRNSMDEAIRTTLQPVLGDTRVRVRFSVPRARLSESTVSSVLRIVRELVTNAIRHGEASAVDIAGCLDGDTVLFSVSDDGRGFEPAAAPGIESGHFGLQGIRERLAKLHGALTIASRPGIGTKVRAKFELKET